MFCKLYLNKTLLSIFFHRVRYQETLIAKLPPVGVLGPHEPIIKAIRGWTAVFIFILQKGNWDVSHLQTPHSPGFSCSTEFKQSEWFKHYIVQAKYLGQVTIKSDKICSWRAIVLLKMKDSGVKLQDREMILISHIPYHFLHC